MGERTNENYEAACRFCKIARRVGRDGCMEHRYLWRGWLMSGDPVPCPGSGVVLAGDPPWVICRECGVQTGTEELWPFGRMPRVRVIDHSRGFDHSETP